MANHGLLYESLKFSWYTQEPVCVGCRRVSKYQENTIEPLVSSHLYTVASNLSPNDGCSIVSTSVKQPTPFKRPLVGVRLFINDKCIPCNKECNTGNNGYQ